MAIPRPTGFLQPIFLLCPRSIGTVLYAMFCRHRGKRRGREKRKIRSEKGDVKSVYEVMDSTCTQLCYWKCPYIGRRDADPRLSAAPCAVLCDSHLLGEFLCLHYLDAYELL